VDRESEPAEQQGEQENKQDERHGLISFFLDGGPGTAIGYPQPGGPHLSGRIDPALS